MDFHGYPWVSIDMHRTYLNASPVYVGAVTTWGELRSQTTSLSLHSVAALATLVAVFSGHFLELVTLKVPLVSTVVLY